MKIESFMKRLALFILLASGMPGLQAQQRLTLEQCRGLALENSEEMKIARFRVAQAEAGRAAMKTLCLPMLSGSLTGIYLHKTIKQELTLPTRIPDPATGTLQPNVMVNPLTGEVVLGADGNPLFNLYAWLPLEISLKGAYLAGLSLQQPLYTGGKIAAGVAMSRIGAGMAADNLELQRANTLCETGQAYWLYVSVQEKVKLAEAYEELLERLEKRVENAWETGMTTRNEWLKVSVKRNEAKLQLQKARSGRELARMALCRVTGLPFDTPIETVDTVPSGKARLAVAAEPETLEAEICAGAEAMDDAAYAEAAGLADRPEYRILQKNVDMAGEQLRLVRAGFLPTAGISLGYSHAGGISIGPEDFSLSSPNLLASVKIPLFHWGEGRQKQLSAQHDREIRETELEKNGRLMALEMEQARLNLRDARLRVEMAAAAMEQAEENLRVSSDTYEVGMDLLTGLLEAQTQWQHARSEQIEAGADLRMKESAWLKAAGKLK